MLRELESDLLWIAEMPAAALGFEFGARMTVVRLKSGKIFVHSPIELSQELKQEIDQLGEVGFVVSPFRFHYLHLKEFAIAYPRAKFFAAPNFDPQKLPEVHFSGALKKEPQPEWEADFDQLIVRGNRLNDEAVFFHRASRTLMLTDLCFNIPSERSLWTRLQACALGVYEQLAPSRHFKLLTRNRTLVRQTVRKILEWDFERIILAHGDIVEKDGKEQFRRAFEYLLPRARRS